jgi:hypothetical protein
MQMFPSNLLPTYPSGRIARVGELLNLGVINQQEAAKLLDFPDTEALVSRKTAPLEDIDRTLDLIVEDGEFNPPEPMQDLEYGVRTAIQVYSQSKINGVPEDRLELLRLWIVQAQDLTAQAQGQQGQQGGAPVQEQPVQPGLAPQDLQGTVTNIPNVSQIQRS